MRAGEKSREQGEEAGGPAEPPVRKRVAMRGLLLLLAGGVLAAGCNSAPQFVAPNQVTAVTVTIVADSTSASGAVLQVGDSATAQVKGTRYGYLVGYLPGLQVESSDPAVVAVTGISGNDAGLLAKGAGTARITAFVGSVSGSAMVEVDSAGASP